MALIPSPDVAAPTVRSSIKPDRRSRPERGQHSHDKRRHYEATRASSGRDLSRRIADQRGHDFAVLIGDTTAMSLLHGIPPS
jgi:hypothetical protein